jgi:flagellar hook-associated protein 1
MAVTGLPGMINPGFFGYYNTQRGLLTAQTGINTVNHNISNAQTPGYTKQRVDQRTLPALESPSRNSALGAVGQLGQGTIVQQIIRVNDAFLDGQIRNENANSEFQQLKSNVLNQIESTLGEPSDSGLQASLQTFFNAAQDMSLSPESVASRTVFARAAEDLVTVFKQKATALQALRNTYVGESGNASSVAASQVATIAGQANQLLRQVADLNQQIVMVTGTGGHANDLLDARDEALKSLNALMPISVTFSDSGQSSVSIGTGSGSVQVLAGNRLIDTLNVVVNPGPTPAATDVPALVQLNTAGTTLNSLLNTGKVGALLEVGGNTTGVVSIQSTLQTLNTLFNTVATAVNTVQTTGRDLNGTLATSTPVFSLASGSSLAIFRYSINSVIINDPRRLAAASDDSAVTGGFAGVSDGRNALALAQLKQATYSALGNATPTDYLIQGVGNVGSAVAQAEKQGKFQQQVLSSLEQQRSQFSGVNIDEEMIDLLRYQRAFEASAKVLNTFDEMTKTILNMLQG